MFQPALVLTRGSLISWEARAGRGCRGHALCGGCRQRFGPRGGVLIHIKGVYRVTSVLLWTCTACLESTAGLGPSLHLAEDSKQSGCTARGDWVGIEEHLLAG